MRRNLSYLAVILATFVLAAAMQLEFGYFLVGFEVLLWAGAWLDAWYLRRSIRAAAVVPKERCERGKPFFVDVKLENGGLLPVPEVYVEVLLKDRFTGKCSGLSGTASLDRKESAALRFEARSKHCGAWEVMLSRVAVWDHLGLVRLECPVEESIQSFFLLPERAEAEGVNAAGSSSEAEEGANGTLRKAEDVGADYELRPFQPGDGLKKIHWKVTAKTEDLIVRTFEMQEARQVTLALEPVPPAEETPTHPQWDRYLEALERLSSALLSGSAPYAVLWTETKGGILRRFPVEDEASRQWMMCAVERVPDETGLGFGECDETLFEGATEKTSLRLGWGDVAQDAGQAPDQHGT